MVNYVTILWPSIAFGLVLVYGLQVNTRDLEFIKYIYMLIFVTNKCEFYFKENNTDEDIGHHCRCTVTSKMVLVVI